MPFMSILFSILILVILFGFIWWIASLLPFPEPFKQVALAVIGVIFLLYLLSLVFGFAGPFPVFRPGYRY